MALEFTLAYKSSIPPVMYPAWVDLSRAWQYLGIDILEGIGIKADVVKPKTKPLVAVFPIIIVRKSWRVCSTF